MVKKFIILKKTKCGLAFLSTVLVLAFGLYVYSWRPIPFDSKVWLEAKAKGDDKLRQRMCRSLIDQISASKPTITEVQLLLGPPDFHPVEAIYTYKVGRGP